MQRGKLTLVTGCMFSGKTTSLIRMAVEAKKMGKKVEVFYPEIDTRYEKNFITSHSDLSHESVALPIDVSEIDATGIDVVILDEIHFFEMSIIFAIQKLQDQGIDVITGGLDTDFRREKFPVVTRIMEIADEVINLQAVCVICGKPAMCTQRKTEDQTLILVGGDEMYEARCEECYVAPNVISS